MILKKTELDKILPSSADSRKSVSKHPNREKYWADLQAGKSLEEIYKNVKKNIGQKVLGFIRIKIKRWKGYSK